MNGLEKRLGVRGRAFWDAALEKYEFDPHELQVLLEACRSMDTIDDLAVSVRTDGVMTVGSQGQPVLNGAVAELRQQQSALARLLTQLNLDSAELGQALSAKQASARAAAQKRWRDRKAVSGA